MIIKKKNKNINNINNINNMNSGNILKIDSTEKKFKKEKNYKISSEMFNNTEIINKNDKDNDNTIINKIGLKDISLSIFCSCGKRKRNKIYKILIDESMNIIRNKLDIFNIFRNLCSIEHSKNDLNLNKNPYLIDMSKKCINELSEILE